MKIRNNDKVYIKDSAKNDNLPHGRYVKCVGLQITNNIPTLLIEDSICNKIWTMPVKYISRHKPLIRNGKKISLLNKTLELEENLYFNNQL